MKKKVFQLLLKDQTPSANLYLLNEETIRDDKVIEKKTYDIFTQFLYTTHNNGVTVDVKSFSARGVLDNIPDIFRKYFEKDGHKIPPTEFPTLTVELPETPVTEYGSRKKPGAKPPSGFL